MPGERDEIAYSRLTLPREVRDAEREYLKGRRTAAGDGRESSEDGKSPTIGLALSGGGIRAATFHLGVLQTLARKGALRLADYMCTVSGGGYIGSSLSSLLTTEAGAGSGKDDWKLGGDFDTSARLPLSHPDQVHHLRKHGDFLILREGLFRREVLRVVGTFLMGLLSSLALFATLLLLVTGFMIAYVSLLSGGGLWEHVRSQEWPGWSEALALLPPDPRLAALALATGAVVAALPWLYSFIRPPVPRQDKASRGETAEEYSARFRLWCFASVLLVFGFVLLPLAAWYAIRVAFADRAPVVSCLLLPPAFFAGGLLATILLYVLLCARNTEAWNDRMRSLFGAMHGICLYCAAASLSLAALVPLVWWLRQEDLLDWLAGGSLLSLAATRLVARRGAGPAEGARWKTLRVLAPKIVLLLAVPVLLVSAALLLTVVAIDAGLLTWTHGLWILGLAFLVFLALGTLIDFNRIGPHYFYRDRLTEAYLRTEAPTGGKLDIVRDDSSLPLSRLHERCRDRGGVMSPAPNPSPYHLVLCAVNLGGSRDLARKNRKSDHFIFSRCYCGSSTTGYIPTQKYRRGRTKLCTAMTISGAAAASAMGYYTSFTRAFAMTLFNIRLGYWLLNPRIYDCDHSDGEPAVIYPRHSKPPRRWVDEKRYPGPFLRLLRTFGERSVFWPKYLLKELMARTDARDALVNLSDGGHTGDNIGIYPLLQRRCDLIIASDAERDPDYNFNSLASAIRQIYTDENVEVKIDLSRIGSAAAGAARVHCAIGRITYPPAEEFDDGRPSRDPDAVGKPGWLIYLKSSVAAGRNRGADGGCASMPPTVLSYASRHADFPHQTTADQFFDDDQFEAYRALGEHIAEEALRSAFAGLAGRGALARDARQLLEWCEKEYRRDSTSEAPSGDAGATAARSGGAATAADGVARTLPRGRQAPRAAKKKSGKGPSRKEVLAALRDSGGNRAQAADVLGLSAYMLKKKITEYGIAEEES